MKKRKSLIIAVLLLLVGVSTAYVAGTYAKYTGEVSGDATVTVAKWNFEDDNALTTINVDLAENYEKTILADGKIAPGTSGSFAIDLKNTSEVAVAWNLSVGSATNKPTNLKFYKDAAHTVELTPGETTITGKLAQGDSTGLTVNVYWTWPYETGAVNNNVAAGDGVDTDDGKDAKTLTVPVTIKGVQIAPVAEGSNTAITSQID